MEGRIRIFPGIEVDILSDGALDLSDEVLAQMDVVIASVHSLFNMPEQEMTERVLRAIENPYVRILGHPTGRLLLRREGLPDQPAARCCGARRSWEWRWSTMRIPTGWICATAICAWRRKWAAGS